MSYQVIEKLHHVGAQYELELACGHRAKVRYPQSQWAHLVRWANTGIPQFCDTCDATRQEVTP